MRVIILPTDNTHNGNQVPQGRAQYDGIGMYWGLGTAS